MKPKSKTPQSWARVERAIGLAADAGAIAMDLRDKPTRLDWIGLGVRALALAVRVRMERRSAAARCPWSYFEAQRGGRRVWFEVPQELREPVLAQISEVAVVPEYWDGMQDSVRVCLGTLDGEQVGWLEDDESICDGPYVRAERAAATYRTLGERMQTRLGSRHCAYLRGGGLIADPFDRDGEVVPTAQMVALVPRMRAFLDGGVSRSYMFVGQPGTGKSVGVRWLVRELGLSSLRVNVGALQAGQSRGDGDVAASLETLVQLLEPEALVLDDLDRVTLAGPLLHFLELAARSCRLVLATANCTAKMLGAALRPGRFDEVIEVEALDAAVLRRLLGADADLAGELAELPLAYIADFVKRRAVLGRERAVAELDDLRKRYKRIDKKTRAGH